jgi:phospholipase/carboxylesterase
VQSLTRVELAGLTTRIVGPADAKLTCLLMHGLGATGDDLVSLADVLDPGDRSVRFVYPDGQLDISALYGAPPGAARAWWIINLEQFVADQQRGVVRDRSQDVPAELPDARARINQLIDELAPRQLVIGGFSQGAMLALDVALRRATPPAGLILWSGTRIAASEWTPLLPGLAGVPIVMSHGRQDPILPFAVSEQLRDQLVAAGAKVTWTPFSGGHEIPMPPVAAAAALLRRLG